MNRENERKAKRERKSILFSQSPLFIAGATSNSERCTHGLCHERRPSTEMIFRQNEFTIEIWPLHLILCSHVFVCLVRTYNITAKARKHDSVMLEGTETFLRVIRQCWKTRKCFKYWFANVGRHKLELKLFPCLPTLQKPIPCLPLLLNHVCVPSNTDSYKIEKRGRHEDK